MYDKILCLSFMLETENWLISQFNLLNTLIDVINIVNTDFRHVHNIILYFSYALYLE